MEIKIGEAISKPKRINQYELDVRNMSGDGNCYEHNISYYQQNAIDDLERDLTLLDEFKKIPSGYQNEKPYKKPLYDAMKAKFNLDENEVSDLIYDLIGSDVTSDSGIAGLDMVALFYWNEDGAKHEATYTL